MAGRGFGGEGIEAAQGRGRGFGGEGIEAAKGRGRGRGGLHAGEYARLIAAARGGGGVGGDVGGVLAQVSQVGQAPTTTAAPKPQVAPAENEDCEAKAAGSEVEEKEIKKEAPPSVAKASTVGGDGQGLFLDAKLLSDFNKSLASNPSAMLPLKDKASRFSKVVFKPEDKKKVEVLTLDQIRPSLRAAFERSINFMKQNQSSMDWASITQIITDPDLTELELRQLIKLASEKFELRAHGIERTRHDHDKEFYLVLNKIKPCALGARASTDCEQKVKDKKLADEKQKGQGGDNCKK